MFKITVAMHLFFCNYFEMKKDWIFIFYKITRLRRLGYFFESFREGFRGNLPVRNILKSINI